MKRKNYFTDPFSEIVKPDIPSESSTTAQKPKTISTVWTDKRTGAQYMVKENVPMGPQGDFRVSSEEADYRYRMAMGLPTNNFVERPTENPFQDERIEPEPMVDQRQIDQRIRERAFHDVGLEQKFRPKNETEDTTEALQDHGDYYTDAKGRIRDKPFNVVGPFGTVDDRGPSMPSMWTTEQKKVAHTQPNRQDIYKGLQRPIDPIEERVRSNKGLQMLLTNAFRGLMTSGPTNVNKTERPTFDGLLGQEQQVSAHSMIDLGLIKPWEPRQESYTQLQGQRYDRPQKPEQMAYSVGQKALALVLGQPTMPEILDIKHMRQNEKDDLTVLLGRTILNSVAVAVPNTKVVQRPEIEESKRKSLEAFSKSLTMNIKPEVLRGLVPPEMLSDRRILESNAVQRIQGTIGHKYGAPERDSTQRQLQESVPEGYKNQHVGRPVTLNSVNAINAVINTGSSSLSSSTRPKRQNMFDQDIDLSDWKPNRNEDSLVRSEAPRVATDHGSRYMNTINNDNSNMSLNSTNTIKESNTTTASALTVQQNQSQLFYNHQ